MNFNQVLLIVNPISGDLDKKQIIQQAREYANTHQITIHLFATTGEEDVEKIQDRLDSLKIERIIAIGGDGTINLVAKAIKSYGIPLGIIPAGSANGLATNFGIPESIEEQVKIAFGDTIFEMDLLNINDDICLHLSDLGINAELIQNYEDSRFRGKFGYLLQSLPTLLKSEYPFEFEVETNFKKRQTSGALLAIANANKYGTGANINPNGKLDDGKFEIIIYRKLDLAEIIKTVRNETDVNSDVVEIFQASEAKITCKTPVAFQIDGEFKGENSEVKIGIMEEKLKVVVPAEFNSQAPQA
ncbi:YegS/Rv2252/BmrU family lipid kinase [Gramella sp. Hel_I_59]|uniref:diacylglycerol/lipid kinase family protein n=1 Tax=Gramella sp. Hel_I_59 TaxID=1249978 RepID=UPI0011503A21|nr:YegS/Rv2252/BmrU family lipid kinase [Gramella sp. Hel_I_59]TQI71014.1 YegS/Rv2252/BmrU family lipid kinase [Gramella sp. Hel_I_59]